MSSEQVELGDDGHPRRGRQYPMMKNRQAQLDEPSGTKMKNLSYIALLLSAQAVYADLPQDDWAFEDGYRNDLLYVHSLVNYAWDLEAQYAWERKQFVNNSLRVNTGSASSDRLFTDIDLSLNQPLNDKWRLSARFERDGQRRRTVVTEQLLLGFERSLFENSAAFVTVNPEYDKSLLDVAIGYALYRDNREQYLRLSVLLEDFNFESKNDVGGTQEQQGMFLEWVARWRLAGDWFVYSEGRVGQGFERRFTDAAASPELASQAQRNNRAELRFSRQGEDGALWSFWGEWVDFEDARTFRTPGFDYEYGNREFTASVEHVRLLAEHHRLRLLAHYVDRKAESVGFKGHQYERKDILGGAFYEYLRANSGISVGYAPGVPDFDYVAVDPDASYALGDFSDKLIVGFRYTFSEQAEVRASLSQELSQRGFGGGAVQFQLFF